MPESLRNGVQTSMTEQEIHRIVEKQREFFRSGKTLDISWRIGQLKKLKDAVLIGKTHLNLPLREHPYGGSNEKIKMRLLKIFER